MRPGLLFGVLWMVASSSRAALYSNYVDTAIPDGNLAGLQNVLNVSGWTGGTDFGVKVTVDVTGGWNGDLYAYLTHGDSLVVLLNRVGRGQTTSGSSALGYGDAGLLVTFASGVGNADVHWYQNNSPSYNGGGQLTGNWEVDGRNISPLSSRASFDANGSTNLLAFNGSDPNGNWTIFFADVVNGDQSRLRGWSLELTAVPEPTTVALGIFLAAAAGGKCWIYMRRRWFANSGKWLD